MSKNRVPSNEDFARASAALRHRSRGLSKIRERVLSFFHESDLHEFFILDCSETSFRAYVFYRWDHQIEEAKSVGFSAQLINTVFDELEMAGRGGREMVQVEFEFDSHENVERSFGGDYFNRIR